MLTLLFLLNAAATVKRGDKVLTRQRSTVFLNAGEGNIPLR